MDCRSLPGFSNENVDLSLTEGEQSPAKIALNKRECKVALKEIERQRELIKLKISSKICYLIHL